MPPSIVFVTAHAEHALQAFELDAADYLTKPVRAERLQATLQRVAQRRRAPGDAGGMGMVAGSVTDDVAAGLLTHGRPDDGGVIVVQDRGRLLRVPVATVLYLKAELKYLTLRTDTHSHLLDGTLGDYEQRLGAPFLRIHRNALVARRAVRALERASASPRGIETSTETGTGTFTVTETGTGTVEHPEAADGWLVVLNGVEERLPVSRRQLPAVRAALLAADQA